MEFHPEGLLGNDSSCSPSAILVPRPGVRMFNWISTNSMGVSSSRFSMFCINNIGLQCTQQNTHNKNAKNNICKNEKKNKFQICSYRGHLFFCDNCFSFSPGINSCENIFRSKMILNLFKWNKLGQGIGFRLSMLFKANGDSVIQYSYHSYALRKEAVHKDCSVYCMDEIEGQTSHIDETNQRKKSLLNKTKLSNKRFCNSGSPEEIKSCLFPQPFKSDCIEIPCDKRSPCIGLDCYNNVHSNSFHHIRIESWKTKLTEPLLIASTISLSITLILYKVIPGLQSRYGYYQINCYASYLISLILCFVNVNVSSVYALCYTGAVVLHFFLLSSFFWMFVTGISALHVFKVLNTQIANDIQGGSRNGSLRFHFNIYYVIGYGFPAVLVTICFLCDMWFWPNSIMYGFRKAAYKIGNETNLYSDGNVNKNSNYESERDSNFESGHDDQEILPLCWIGQNSSLMTFFIVPTGIILSLNCFLFCGCLFFFLSTFQGIQPQRISKRQRSMTFVFCKLLIGTGIQWIFGVFTYFYPKNEIVWMIFEVTVASHGSFILVTTLCLERVRKQLAALITYK